ncbi:MAG: hypothetical protein JEZ09_05595 [Salinivirgaceae bacterium]|nr:hypothetical protein [Salinivirgaceae bacterium]
MNKGVLIWGYLSSFILLLGAIFMNLNLVAGKVLYLTGFFAFNLGYLVPLFYVIFKENQENKIGLVIVFGILGFLTFLTGVSFFMINWGGGIILIYTGGSILILAILTIIALSRRFYETHIDAWFPVLIFGVFIVISMLTGMVHRHVMRVFTINNKESIELIESVQIKNKILFNQLILLDTTNYKDLTQINLNTKILRKETQYINEYIENLKFELIKEVEGSAYKLLNSKRLENLVPVQSNVEINSVNRFMLKRKKGKAKKLKLSLIHFKEIVSGLIPKNEQWLKNYVEINLNTKTHKLDNRRFNRDWENQQFYSFPLVTVLNQLSKIQFQINLVEGELLNYYYQEALKLGKGNIETVIKDTAFVENQYK